LIDALSFIRSKAHWGAAFRFGVVRVPESDFALIAAAMGRSFAADFASTVQSPQLST
jgi:hypothetical protein